jgi:UDP-N-acetylglucosamine enolpyruvyl transferase
MACIPAGKVQSQSSTTQFSDRVIQVIAALQRENDILMEEVRQLRATVHIYSALAARLSARQASTVGGLHETV